MSCLRPPFLCLKPLRGGVGRRGSPCREEGPRSVNGMSPSVPSSLCGEGPPGPKGLVGVDLCLVSCLPKAGSVFFGLRSDVSFLWWIVHFFDRPSGFCFCFSSTKSFDREQTSCVFSRSLKVVPRTQDPVRYGCCPLRTRLCSYQTFRHPLTLTPFHFDVVARRGGVDVLSVYVRRSPLVPSSARVGRGPFILRTVRDDKKMCFAYLTVPLRTLFKLSPSGSRPGL